MRLSLNRPAFGVLLLATAFTSERSFGAYSVTTVIKLPFNSTDGTAANTPVTYTDLGLSGSANSLQPGARFLGNPNGLVGVLRGGTNADPNSSISSVFTYDATNGLRLIGDHSQSSNGSESESLSYENLAGQVLGSSQANATDSSTTGLLGQIAWAYTPTGGGTLASHLGLTGPNFGYTVSYTNTSGGTTTGTFARSTANFSNLAGEVAGVTSRYAGDGSSVTTSPTVTPTTGLGQSAWVYLGATPTEIGLIDSSHSFTVTTNTSSGATARSSFNQINGVDTAGRVYGFASNYYDNGAGLRTSGISLGNDGWVSSGGVTTAIGLYQSGQTPTVTNFSGFSYSKNASTGSTTSASRSTFLGAPAPAGYVPGTSSYYSSTGSSLGTDAFIYDANVSSNNYTQVGLITNGFASGSNTTTNIPAAGTTSFVNTTGVRSSNVYAVNATKQAAGTSTEYFSTGTAINSGPVPYFTNSSGNSILIPFAVASDPHIQATTLSGSQTSPTATFVATGAFRGAVTQLTDSGLVGGYYTRYRQPGSANPPGNTGFSPNELGQDAFVYDSNTSTTYLLDPTGNIANDNNYDSVSIDYLGADGTAVGQYTAGGAVQNFNSNSFIWSKTIGFVDLASAVSPSLSSYGFQNLIDAYYEGLGGSTIYSTAGTVDTASNTTTLTGLVVLNGSVPEPTSLSLLGVGSLALLRRRNRKVG